MVKYYTSSSDIDSNTLRNRLLRDLDTMLEQFGKNIREFDLPEMTSKPELVRGMPRCIEDELTINVPQDRRH